MSRGGFGSADSFLAVSMSSSAFSIHWAVWRFIKDLALFHYLVQAPVAIILAQSLFDLPGCPDNQIKRKWPLKGQVDANRLRNRVARRHDDEQVNVAFFMRRAIRV